MKKVLLFIAFAFISIGAYAQATWISQATGFTPISSGVRNVCAVDTNVVWISSYDGSGGGANRQDYSRTIDGGLTWTAGTTGAPATHDWSMIFATDADHAWAVYWNFAVGTGGGIWHTSDGGATWNQQGVGTIFNASSFPNVVYFWDSNLGMAMGDPNPIGFEIYTTTDGGTTWVPVPAANIPAPLAGEFGYTGNYSVIGNTIWFDTNKGRVYKSIDNGLNWTVAATGIIPPANNALDLVFYSANNGIARLYNQATGANTVRLSADGGATWAVATPTGSLFGSDLRYVPGTASKLISTGAITGFVGSSYSDDGGLTWTVIETLAQRTALGVVDSNTMWAGGFTTSPTSDGIFKYALITPVACGDPSITAGLATASSPFVCPDDTLTVTSSGVVAPTVGAYAGISWIITTGDVTGTSDPLNEPTLVAAYNFNFPAPSVSIRQYIHDGVLLANGTYYWTPIAFGNATAAVIPPVFLFDLTLDPTCTYGGNSVMVNLLDATDPLCFVGIPEIPSAEFSMHAFFTEENMLNVLINSLGNDKSSVEIYDVTGRKVYSHSHTIVSGENTILIPVENMEAGTYIIKAEAGNSKAVEKLIKL